MNVLAWISEHSRGRNVSADSRLHQGYADTKFRRTTRGRPPPNPRPRRRGARENGCSSTAATPTLPLPRLRPFLVLSRRCGLNGPPHCVGPRHLNPHCLDSPAGRPAKTTLPILSWSVRRGARRARLPADNEFGHTAPDRALSAPGCSEAATACEFYGLVPPTKTWEPEKFRN